MGLIAFIGITGLEVREHRAVFPLAHLFLQLRVGLACFCSFGAVTCHQEKAEKDPMPIALSATLETLQTSYPVSFALLCSYAMDSVSGFSP